MIFYLLRITLICVTEKEERNWNSYYKCKKITCAAFFGLLAYLVCFLIKANSGTWTVSTFFSAIKPSISLAMERLLSGYMLKFYLVSALVSLVVTVTTYFICRIIEENRNEIKEYLKNIRIDKDEAKPSEEDKTSIELIKENISSEIVSNEDVVLENNSELGDRKKDSSPLISSATEDVSKKSRLKTLLLCFFLGLFGIHRFYVGKKLTGAIYPVSLVFMIILASLEKDVTNTIGGLLLFALLIYYIVDLFLILFGTFKDCNRKYIKQWK